MSNENSQYMDIAIVGMAGRFPGAPSVDALWRLLQAGEEALTAVTEQDSAQAGLSESTFKHPSYVRRTAQLDGVELFDAGFFGYSPKQASEIDPQQRVFLETAWAALEDGGLDPTQFAGRIGVFAGVGANRYSLRGLVEAYQQQRMADILQQTINADKDFLSTRVSYKLDLRGPSLTIQTACSTSLSAVHLACQSLCLGECDAALAGGVSITVPQGIGYVYHEGSILSPDGHCRPFDAEALGTVPGSGVGVVMLRRLEDALQDGDQIYAVIKNSAINNDGAQKVGYTAPSVNGQVSVVRAALDALAPQTIGMLEAHGTGTVLGDSVELSALLEVFGGCAPQSCALGSVKANIGHLDAAAGIAGLIKSALCLKHRALLPMINVRTPNPLIATPTSPFLISDEFRPWPQTDTPRRAAVSSFGMGGTNAHLILEEAPAAAIATVQGGAQLVPLSARDAAGLRAIASNLADHLERDPTLELADLAFTLQSGRKRFNLRRVIVAENRAQLLQALRDHASSATESQGKLADLGFIFPQMSTQDLAAAARLDASNAAFHRQFDSCASRLRDTLGIDIRAVMQQSPSQAASANGMQRVVAMVAVYCLTCCLVEWGAQPAHIAGAGDGELSAAVFAGALTLEQATRVLLGHIDGGSADPWAHPIGTPASKRYAQFLPASCARPIDVESRADIDAWLARLSGANAATATMPTTPGLHLGISFASPAGWHDGVPLHAGHTPASAPHLALLGLLWLHGADIRWAALHVGYRPRHISLPGFPFDHQRYWSDDSSAFARPHAAADAAALDTATDPARWFHVPRWQPSPHPEAPTPSAIRGGDREHWLIFADELGAADALLARIVAAGGAHTVVRAGTAFAEEAAGRYRIHPAEKAQYEQLIQRLHANNQTPSRILHGWNLQASDNGFASVLYAVQAVARIHPYAQMAVLTQHLVNRWLVPDDGRLAALPALAAVTSRELPGVPLAIIDLPEPTTQDGRFDLRAEQIDGILSELTSPSGEITVVYRDRRRLVQRFENIALDPALRGNRGIRTNGTYLITGGLGRIGLAIAAALARDHGANVVLLARRGSPLPSAQGASPSEAVLATLRSIEASGGKALVIAADVADRSGLAAAIAQAEREFGTVHGVFHLAGALGETSARTPLEKLTREDLASQARPKIEGLRALDDVLAGKDLDFGVLFGSVASTLGGVGFGAYAAANAYFGAHAARGGDAKDVPWLALDWDEWSDHTEALSNPLALNTAEGLEALWQAIDYAPASGFVISKSRFGERVSELHALRRAGTPAPAVPAPAAVQEQEPEQAPASTRPTLNKDYAAPSTDLEHSLVGIWERCLGINGIGIDDDFFELGGDSMIMLDMLSRIEDSFHVEIPLRSLMQSELTVRIFADMLASRLAAA